MYQVTKFQIYPTFSRSPGKCDGVPQVIKRDGRTWLHLFTECDLRKTYTKNIVEQMVVEQLGNVEGSVCACVYAPCVHTRFVDIFQVFFFEYV